MMGEEPDDARVGHGPFDLEESKLDIEVPINGSAFYYETKYSLFDVACLMQELYREYELNDEHERFVRAVYLAALGLHPHFRISLEEAVNGKKFQSFEKAQRHILATEIADVIDLAVAKGAKLESEVATICQLHGLSRREVFRFLSETRSLRKLRLESLDLFDDDGPGWHLPEGFQIAKDGRIVPAMDKC